MMQQKGLVGPTRQLPLNIGLPLLSHAALEEDDELQDRWAALLVNAADGDSGTEVRRAFVSILADMTAIDACVLEMIARTPNRTVKAVQVSPKTGTTVIYDSIAPLPPASDEVKIVLSNLRRLGCVNLQLTMDGGVSYEDVSITPLGAAFIKACTEPKKQ
jgi:hypothetical protein